MKTQQEILNRIEERKDNDFLGFEVSEYVDFLELKNAKEYLKKGVGEKKWNKVDKKPTRANIVKIMKDYMSFAWDKANNMRGISANRSIDHYTAWLWLLGDEKLRTKFKETEYEHYGKEKLIVICEHLNWNWKKWDNGVRTNG